MEGDDDEFGDLYTDVLRPSSSSSAPIPPILPSPNSSPDLSNLNNTDDEVTLHGASSPKLPLPSTHDALRDHPKPCSPFRSPQKGDEGEGGGEKADMGLNDPVSDAGQEAEIRVQDAEKGRVSTEERMDIEVGIGDLDCDSVIPGLSTGASVVGIYDGSSENGGGVKKKDDSGGDDEDDWDSDDSEDDLQIVLNDTRGPIGVECNEDEDGEDLVIVADDGDQQHPPIEEQEWGEEVALPVADGERKEVGEAIKGNGGLMLGTGAGGARIVYGSHPHHSPFKVSFSMKMLDSCSRLLFPFEREWKL